MPCDVTAQVCVNEAIDALLASEGKQPDGQQAQAGQKAGGPWLVAVVVPIVVVAGEAGRPGWCASAAPSSLPAWIAIHLFYKQLTFSLLRAASKQASKRVGGWVGGLRWQHTPTARTFRPACTGHSCACLLASHAHFTQPLLHPPASSPACRAAGGRVCGPVGALYEAPAAAGRGRPVPQVSVLWVWRAGARQQRQQAAWRGPRVHRQQRPGPRQWGGQRRGGRVSAN